MDRTPIGVLAFHLIETNRGRKSEDLAEGIRAEMPTIVWPLAEVTDDDRVVEKAG
jgi:hypothetical protein